MLSHAKKSALKWLKPLHKSFPQYNLCRVSVWPTILELLQIRLGCGSPKMEHLQLWKQHFCYQPIVYEHWIEYMYKALTYMHMLLNILLLYTKQNTTEHVSTFIGSCSFTKLATRWRIYFLVIFCNFLHCSSVWRKCNRGKRWSFLSEKDIITAQSKIFTY